MTDIGLNSSDDFIVIFTNTPEDTNKTTEVIFIRSDLRRADSHLSWFEVSCVSELAAPTNVGGSITRYWCFLQLARWCWMESNVACL